MKFGLSDKQLDEIINILSRYEKVKRAYIFGSRALGTYKKASDIDIAVSGDEKIDFRTILKLKNDFEESNLPFFVDIVDIKSIENEELKEHIKKHGKNIYIKRRKKKL